jgi:hypothetical protein
MSDPTSLPPGEYRLIGPDDKEIFRGGLQDAWQVWPGTQAQRQAVEDMYRVEKHKQDAEAQLAKAQDQALKLTHLADELLTRCEAYVSNCEAREQEARDREASEAEAKAEQEEQERLAAIAAALAPIPGPNGEEPLAAPDHGDLEANAPVDPEERGYPASEEDDEGPVPLTYGKLPLSYVKGESSTDPPPLAPPGEPKPEPGSRLYPARPGIAQPTAISLNSAGE